MPPNSPHRRLVSKLFSDGVIAVIITIMVLELSLTSTAFPASAPSSRPSASTPSPSPLLLGIYWINHHHLGSHCTATRPTRPSFMPTSPSFALTPALLYSYLIDKKIDSFSVALYAVSMAITGFSFLLLRIAIGTRLRKSGALEAEDKAAQTKHLMSLAMYGIAAPLAFYRPYRFSTHRPRYPRLTHRSPHSSPTRTPILKRGNHP